MNCLICGCYPEAITRCFSHSPFIDGRKYELVCHVCASVPKSWDYVDGEIIVHKYQSSTRLNTQMDMEGDGWNADEAATSIRAVQKLLKNPKIVLDTTNKAVFAELFLTDGKYMEIVLT